MAYLEVIPEINNKSGEREKGQRIQCRANIKVAVASNGSILLGCPTKHRRASGLSLGWGKTEYLSACSFSVLTESYLPSSFFSLYMTLGSYGLRVSPWVLRIRTSQRSIEVGYCQCAVTLNLYSDSWVSTVPEIRTGLRGWGWGTNAIWYTSHSCKP